MANNPFHNPSRTTDRIPPDELRGLIAHHPASGATSIVPPMLARALGVPLDDVLRAMHKAGFGHRRWLTRAQASVVAPMVADGDAVLRLHQAWDAAHGRWLREYLEFPGQAGREAEHLDMDLRLLRRRLDFLAEIIELTADLCLEDMPAILDALRALGATDIDIETARRAQRRLENLRDCTLRAEEAADAVVAASRAAGELARRAFALAGDRP